MLRRSQPNHTIPKSGGIIVKLYKLFHPFLFPREREKTIVFPRFPELRYGTEKRTKEIHDFVLPFMPSAVSQWMEKKWKFSFSVQINLSWKCNILSLACLCNVQSWTASAASKWKHCWECENVDFLRIPFYFRPEVVPSATTTTSVGMIKHRSGKCVELERENFHRGKWEAFKCATIASRSPHQTEIYATRSLMHHTMWF